MVYLINYLQYRTITPIVTPRFAISCTEGLMKSLGDLAKEYNLPIQVSHLNHSHVTPSFLSLITGSCELIKNLAD